VPFLNVCGDEKNKLFKLLCFFGSLFHEFYVFGIKPDSFYSALFKVMQYEIFPLVFVSRNPAFYMT
jgi:hypothetical protein